jgi:uncharacterized protein (DUF427 family)
MTQASWVKAGPLVFEQSPRRVCAEIDDITVADSTRVLLLWEEGKVLPVYLFPSDDVRTDLLRPSEHPLPEAHHGLASYWTLEVDGRVAENAAWTYSAAPAPEGKRLADYLAFGWGAMDAWYEEEQVLAHPCDHILPKDVRMDLLMPSETWTLCAYKGEASYRSATVGDEVYEDVAWCYPDPLPDNPQLRDLVCFLNERAGIEVDGEQLERPTTQWVAGLRSNVRGGGSGSEQRPHGTE